MECMVVALIIIGIWFAVAESARNRTVKERAVREQAYKNALEALSRDPSNTRLSVKALEAGREHLGGLRPNGKPSIYDEAAINNDIAARRR